MGAFSGVTKRTPSNRTTPSCVPTQTYPSAVWVIARTAVFGRPSSKRQTRRPNSNKGVRGSSPNAAVATRVVLMTAIAARRYDGLPFKGIGSQESPPGAHEKYRGRRTGRVLKTVAHGVAAAQSRPRDDSSAKPSDSAPERGPPATPPAVGRRNADRSPGPWAASRLLPTF